jgi:4-amino-4-deoxy-L-arabinose transferase-like glycosyltransferase
VPALSADPGGGRAPAAAAGAVRDAEPHARLRRWWPLAALTLLAAVLRLSTLDLQSLWYDEAYTPVHVFHASLGASWRAYVHSENSPPLWYLLEWLVTRVLGTGAVALRLLSALAGIATVPVAWAIGSELQGPPTRRAAIVTTSFVATSPLLVWYSQEARAYGLFVLTASLALLCFVRALREPTPRRMWLFAFTATLALLTHYFAVFLLIPMVLALCWRGLANVEQRRRARQARAIPQKIPTLAPLLLPILAGAALIPLIVAQGGHGTQWIGEWALAARLEAIPQYYLTGYTGSALGHGVELLVALAILAGVFYGLWRTLTPQEERGALIALVVAASGVLMPLLLALLGADYLAPRNLVAAMVPVSALLAIVIAARRTGTVGMAIAGVVAAGFLALSVDVNLSPRLQRGDWRGVARLLRRAGWGSSVAPGGARAGAGSAGSAGPIAARALVTVELGAAPLEYYLPPLHNLAQGARARVREVVQTGYAPLRASAGEPPARGMALSQVRNVHGLYVYRFTSSVPVTISESKLRESAITEAPHPEVLVAGSLG